MQRQLLSETSVFFVMTSKPRAVWAISFLALAVAVPIACKNELAKQRPAAPVVIREDFPATESTLSLLEPDGTQCVWAKLDAAAGKRLAISTFAGDRRGGRVALSADRGHGAVWFDPTATSLPMFEGGRSAFSEVDPPAGTRPRLFAVDMATGTATSVPLPSGARDIGFDSQGRMTALTLQELSESETDKGEALVDGAPVKLEPATQGVPVLVHALVFAGLSWKRVETASSTDGWDLALGVDALRAAQDLAFRSTEVLVPHVQGDSETDAALLAKLARFAPQAQPVAGSESWIRFGSGDTRFVLWEASGEFAYSTGLAAFVDPSGNPVKPPGWPYTENDRISYAWNGACLLAAQDHTGTHPRLYRGGKLVWSSDTARAVTFWPRRQP